VGRQAYARFLHSTDDHTFYPSEQNFYRRAPLPTPQPANVAGRRPPRTQRGWRACRFRAEISSHVYVQAISILWFFSAFRVPRGELKSYPAEDGPRRSLDKRISAACGQPFPAAVHGTILRREGEIICKREWE